MATLTNPVTAQNIVDRFEEWVPDHANAGIVWGTNNNPEYSGVEVTLDASFGGTTDGLSMSADGDDIKADGSELIDADAIYNALVTETNRYTSIRKLRARLNVTGTSGESNLDKGPIGTYGIVYDETNVAYLSSNYLQTITNPDNANVEAGELIDDTNLETLFSNFRSAYNTKRDVTITLTRDVCHASCHSSCHGSRGRR